MGNESMRQDFTLFRIASVLVVLLAILVAPNLSIFKLMKRVSGVFGVSEEVWLLLRKVALICSIFYLSYHVLVLVRRMLRRIFVFELPSKRPGPQRYTNISDRPSFKSPLKDEPNSHNARLDATSSFRQSSPVGPVIANTHPDRTAFGSPLSRTPTQAPDASLPSPMGKNISMWSASLTQHLNTHSAASTKLADSSKAELGKDHVGSVPIPQSSSEPAPGRRIVAKREVLSPEISFRYCGMISDSDIYIENVRSWFIRKILAPLNEDIKRTDLELEASGLGHLCCRYPATYSLAAKSVDSDRAKSPYLFSSGIYGGEARRIQTVMDFVRSRPEDPLVKTRLRIERYLSNTSIVAHRVTLIKRISAFAEGSFIASSFLSEAAPSPAAAIELDDSQILLQLFCTFMDENLPSENVNDAQPFSSSYYVPVDEKPSDRLDAIQLQQVSSSPLLLQVIAEDKILQAHPVFIFDMLCTLTILGA